MYSPVCFISIVNARREERLTTAGREYRHIDGRWVSDYTIIM